MCWLKPVDTVNGQWEEYSIGVAAGDWAHGSIVAPLLPGGKLALITGYHSAEEGDYPEIREVPDDPRQGPWPKRMLAKIQYGEEFLVHDMDGDGKLDIVAGRHWLKNLGNGAFEPIEVVTEGFQNIARIRVDDINGDGHPDIVAVEEKVDWDSNVRSPHSLDVADLDRMANWS